MMNMKHLKIAGIQTAKAKKTLDTLAKTLKLEEWAYDIAHLDNTHSSPRAQHLPDASNWQTLLVNGTLDLVLMNLSETPISLHKDLVLAGLSPRSHNASILLLNQKKDKPVKIHDSSRTLTVAVSSELEAAQIQDLLPHAKANIIPELSAKPLLDISDHDAIVISEERWEDKSEPKSEFQKIYLNPKEFIPSPGQGICVFICRKADTSLRKIVQKVHNSATTPCSNVERKLLQLVGDSNRTKLGVYCEQDSSGHYQAYAAWLGSDDNKLRKCHLSQSTNYQLAESIFEKLLKN